jgi:prepilin-type N-terminal cleavage/methylation domain-containing protein
MRSFTLLELVIVIMIVSILAALSYVHYSAYQEKSLDNEAEANLNMIIATERAYRMERGGYYVSVVEDDLNDNLRIFLPTVNMKWDYATVQDLAGLVCCAEATRMVAPGRTFRLCTNGNTPVSGGCGFNAGNCP